MPKEKNRRKDLYHNYLNSPEWEIMRQLVLTRENNKCQKCSTSSNLHIHHGTYTRLFKEKLSDLYCLCSKCHTKLHEPYGTKDLLRVTKAFIDGVKYVPKIITKKKVTKEEKIKRYNKLVKYKNKVNNKKKKIRVINEPKVKTRKFLPNDGSKDKVFRGNAKVTKWKLGDPR